MVTSKNIKIHDIQLNLTNPRTIPQDNEMAAVESMISINPEKFWGLMESIIDNGYYPTENIILLRKSDGSLTVKEGNRRVAILKIIFGYIKYHEISEELTAKIRKISQSWKTNNENLPCIIYEEEEENIADRIVELIHAKGVSASRDEWTAVAKERYDREKRGKSTPCIDLLESYIKNGKNINQQQAERWSGDYPITVLHEALPKICKALGKEVSDVVKSYPRKHKRLIDELLLDIGLNNIGFKEVRSKEKFFGEKYGISQQGNTPLRTPQAATAAPQNAQANNTPSPSSPSPKKPRAISSKNPASVAQRLNAFKISGNNREKLVTLVDELKDLEIKRFPHAFCFLLRSIFEISAKVYCEENTSANIRTTDSNGNDRKLIDMLRDITNYITKNKTDRKKNKELHGALAELAKPEGLLSVTSMNQLVHNPSFSIAPADISLLFHNIFPLFMEMNS